MCVYIFLGHPVVVKHYSICHFENINSWASRGKFFNTEDTGDLCRLSATSQVLVNSFYNFYLLFLHSNEDSSCSLPGRDTMSPLQHGLP